MKSTLTTLLLAIGWLSSIAQSQLFSIDYDTRHFLVATNISNITLQIRWDGPHLDEPIIQNLGPGETLRTQSGNWDKPGTTYQLQYPEELFIYDSTRIIRHMENVAAAAGRLNIGLEVYDQLIEQLMPDYYDVYQYDQGGLIGVPSRQSSGKGFLQLLTGYFGLQAARQMQQQMQLATAAMAHAKLLHRATQKGIQIPELEPQDLVQVIENSSNYTWGIPSYGFGYHGDFASIDDRGPLLYRGTRTFRIDAGLPLEKVIAARPNGTLYGRLFFTARVGEEMANLGAPLGNAAYFLPSSLTVDQGSPEDLIPISAGDSLISWNTNILEVGLIWKFNFNTAHLDFSVVYPIRWDNELSFTKQEVLFGGSSTRLIESTIEDKYSIYNLMPKIGLTYGLGIGLIPTPNLSRKYAITYLNLGASFDFAGYRLSENFPLWYTTGTAVQPEIAPMAQVSPFQRLQFSFSIMQFLPWD